MKEDILKNVTNQIVLVTTVFFFFFLGEKRDIETYINKVFLHKVRFGMM